MRKLSALAGLTVGFAAFIAAGGMPAAATEPVKVDDAVFSWSINAESGAKAYAPGTCNFLVAGEAGSTGGNRTWTKEDGFFKAQEGKVSVYQPRPGGKPELTSWDTKCSTPAGKPVSFTEQSQNYVQISGGTGTVDPNTNSATISWKGSFTIVYYSGYTYWTITDPTLEIKDGHGKITGTFSGYGTSMEDMTKWVKLDPKKGTMADFANAKVTVTDKGFEATPDYLKVTAPEGVDPEQKRDGADWGAFPTDWVKFNVNTGQGAYWYSSGGSADSRKKTNPVKVEYTAPKPSEPTPSEPAPSEPAPSEPSEPTPSQPGPSQPAPGGPSEPAPSQPGPGDPSEPAPGDPKPEDPKPKDPKPEDPAPEDPDAPEPGDDSGVTDPAGENHLPRTGTSLAAAGAGAALLVIGAATLVLTRRTHRS